MPKEIQPIHGNFGMLKWTQYTILDILGAYNKTYDT